ncbi:MAG: hypothetical protein ACYSR0_09075 [Planctomycetota bacterium]|jgi:hypothetical protein
MKKIYMFTFTYDCKTREAIRILKQKSVNLADFCRKSIESYAEQIEAHEKHRRV